MLRELEAEYFTKRAVAHLLGYRNGALQIGRVRVLASTQLRVERLYRRVRALRLAEGASDLLRLHLARGRLELGKGRI